MTVKYGEFEFPPSFGFKPESKVPGFKAGGLVKKDTPVMKCGGKVNKAALPAMKKGGSVHDCSCGMKKGGKVKKRSKKRSKSDKLSPQEQQLMAQVLEQAVATGRIPGMPGKGGVPVPSGEPMIPMQ